MDATPLKRSSDDAGLESPREKTRSVPKISKARACKSLPHIPELPLTCKGAECKRHKIRCEFRPGETTCTKCIRSGIKCVVNDFSQKFVDDDGMYAPSPAPGGVPPLKPQTQMLIELP